MWSFSVIVQEPHDPLSGRSLGGALAKSGLDVGDGIHVAGNHAKMLHAGCARMRMSVDEAGENGLACEINFLAETRGKAQDFRVCAYGENATAADGNRL